MKLSYRQRLFFYFFLLFGLFTLSIIIIQQQNEKKEKTEAIEATLDDYVNITHKYIQLHDLTDSNFYLLRDFDLFLLDNVRISIIDDNGNVLYDKDISSYNDSENHLNRPEIQNALSGEYGINIRTSTTTGKEYIYYARHYDGYFIRVALPYSVATQNLLDANKYFIYVTILLFAVVLIFILIVAGRFEKSILQLKNFTTKIKKNEVLTNDIQFPEDELGEIGEEIMEIFRQKEASIRQTEIEREKLILHFQYSEKGLCIFTPGLEKIYANTHFMYFIHLVLNTTDIANVSDIFKYEAFQPVTNFISDKERDLDHFEYTCVQNEKTFAIQTVIFEDKSFEITIRDITRTEQNRILKQQMTSNIAHELKTPVTSIHAYLESLKEGKFPPEMQQQFIERAFIQSERLAELIDDVGLISKIEEASSLFEIRRTAILQIIEEVTFDLNEKIKQNNISINVSIEADVFVQGNSSLLYAVFRNLIDNSIKYAGKDIEIHISHYWEDNEFHYFSYHDTGKGVEKEHLNRIFERFYRVDTGRTRETGGSGLGLSIVKNAILFHKGKIEAKKHIKGGLQFLFTIRK